MAGALELVEVGVAGEQHRAVPHLPGDLAPGDAAQDRAEEGHTVDVDGGGADVVADGVHALVVTLA